jgi:hypothetical protein
VAFLAPDIAASAAPGGHDKARAETGWKNRDRSRFAIEPLGVNVTRADFAAHGGQLVCVQDSYLVWAHHVDEREHHREL